MIFYLLFFYLLSESMATNSTNDSTSYDMSNKIICYYQANNYYYDGPEKLEVKCIPSECDAILYAAFRIDDFSNIVVDTNILKSVTELNKPVIATIARTNYYTSWKNILNVNGNAMEAKILCEYAKNHAIQGFQICFLAPGRSETMDKNVARNIIPYIKQLKELCPFLIIGVGITDDPNLLTNKDVYNFEELNKIVTYYDADATTLNNCNPELYNGLTPITKSEPGDKYRYGLEEYVSNLKKTAISFTKISIAIPLSTIDNKNQLYPTYSNMCTGGFDNSYWCVQTSQNYFDKGKYLSKENFGIRVTGIEWDDYLNTCNCPSKFNGFYNIYAGYKMGKVIQCAKFDVQSTVYPIK